jgi:carbon monoxide dehydrogenase subunit G
VTTHVERSIEVDVPVRTVYDQWTQFEDFPRFMGGVQQVRQVGDTLTHWVAEIAGVRREWDAEILEQVPDQKVAWAATTGATNAGTVYFDAVGADRTRVRLTLDYEPEGIVEKIGDVLDVVERQAVADLDRFKQFIEARGSATGGWRGNVDDTGAPLVGADAAAAGGVAAADVAAAGVHRDGGTHQADVPGDIVAVGPTGDTRGTLDIEAGPSRSGSVPDVPDLGHSGDPVMVDAQSTGRASTDAERTGTAAGAATSAGVAGFGTDTGLSSSPTSGVFTGSPGSAGGSRSDDAERTGTAAGAATSAGVTGFGTDTGLSSSPTSGVLTGDPGARTASHAGAGTGDLVGEVGTGRAGWSDGPGARDDVTEAATDPVGEDWDGGAGARRATTGTDEQWSSAGGGPGEVREGRATAGEGVVQGDFADENLTTDDVVARDFANRDIAGDGVVERDFAGREITERDIANRGIEDRENEDRGIVTGMGGAHGAPNPDDPANPARPSV